MRDYTSLDQFSNRENRRQTLSSCECVTRKKFQFILLFYNIEAIIRNIGMQNWNIFFPLFDIRIVSSNSFIFYLYMRHSEQVVEIARI